MTMMVILLHRPTTRAAVSLASLKNKIANGNSWRLCQMRPRYLPGQGGRAPP